MDTSIVVAMDRNKLIGANGALPWHLSADLQYFRRITMGKPIVMGRKTHDSIGRPLPGRFNIVVTHNPEYQPAEGCLVVASLEQALNESGNVEEVMVIGGASFYQEALKFANMIYLTEVDTEASGDVYFPDYDKSEWREVSREHHPEDEKNDHDYSFVVLEKKLVSY